MKNLSVAIIITLVAANWAYTQGSDRAAVIGVVDKLFAEMAAANPPGIIAANLPQSQLTAIYKQKDGSSKARVFDGDAFSKLFADKSKVMIEEMYEPRAEIFGDMAMVWGRYVFFVDGKLSHCGVNSFQLVRTTDGWRISGGASTIEPDGCSAAEKKRRPNKSS